MRQALGRGNRVTAFVRRLNSLPLTDNALRVVVGDAMRAEDVVAAMRGQEAVVSALGRRNSFRSDQLISRSLQAIVPAMESAGVRRLILVSRADVARFALTEIEKRAFVRKVAVISY